MSECLVVLVTVLAIVCDLDLQNDLLQCQIIIQSSWEMAFALFLTVQCDLWFVVSYRGMTFTLMVTLFKVKGWHLLVSALCIFLVCCSQAWLPVEDCMIILTKTLTNQKKMGRSYNHLHTSSPCPTAETGWHLGKPLTDWLICLSGSPICIAGAMWSIVIWKPCKVSGTSAKTQTSDECQCLGTRRLWFMTDEKMSRCMILLMHQTQLHRWSKWD